MNEKKILVAYFSATGTTAKTAKQLAAAANADLFAIQPAQPYTSADLDWNNKHSRSSVEMNDPHSRPAIAGKVENMAQYDVVFVGFPVWWYVAPTIINTFMESYDFAGKTVIPFATSGGSGLGKTIDVLRPCCDASVQWKPGKLLNRSSEAEMKAWLNELGL